MEEKKEYNLFICSPKSNQLDAYKIDAIRKIVVKDLNLSDDAISYTDYETKYLDHTVPFGRLVNSDIVYFTKNWDQDYWCKETYSAVKQFFPSMTKIFEKGAVLPDKTDNFKTSKEFLSDVLSKTVSKEDDKKITNHPQRYNGDSPYECVKVLNNWMTLEEYRGFLKGNALKYLCRLGKKDDEVQELKKVQWYVNKLIESYEQETKNDN